MMTSVSIKFQFQETSFIGVIGRYMTSKILVFAVKNNNGKILVIFFTHLNL